MFLDFLYVRVNRVPDGVPLEAVRTGEEQTSFNTAQAAGEALSPWLKSDALGVHSIASPWGNGTARLAVLPIGDNIYGFVAAGSQRQDFPADTERLFLEVGANQATLVLERKWHEEALRDAEERSRSVLDHIIAGIVTIDESGIVQSLNSAGERLFGYDAREVIGHNVRLLMPEPYRTEHDRYIRDYLDTGQAKIIGSLAGTEIR